MERLGSLLLSLGSEVTSDDQVDTVVSSGHTLSSPSSSGYLTLQTSILGTVNAEEWVDSSFTGCSSCFYQQNENSIVNPSFSRDFDLNSIDKSNKSLLTRDIEVTFNEHPGTFSSADSSRSSYVSSRVNSETAETRHIVTTSALPVSAASDRKSWLSETAVLQITSDVSLIQHFVISSQTSPDFVSHMTSPEPTYQLPATINRGHPQIAIQTNSSKVVDYIQLDVATSRNFSDQSGFDQPQEYPKTNISNDCKQTTVRILPLTENVIDSSTFGLQKSSTAKLSHLPYFLEGSITSHFLEWAGTAKTIEYSSELSNFLTVAATFDEISSIETISNVFHSHVVLTWSHPSLQSNSVSISGFYDNSASIITRDIYDSIASLTHDIYDKTASLTHGIYYNSAFPTHGIYDSSVSLTLDIYDNSASLTHGIYDKTASLTHDAYYNSAFLTHGIYDSSFSLTSNFYDSKIVPTLVVYGTHDGDNKISGADYETVQLTLEYSQSWQANRPSLSVTNKTDYETDDIDQHFALGYTFYASLPCDSHRTDSVACTTPADRLETLSSNFEQSWKKGELELSLNPQVVNVATGDTLELRLISNYFSSSPTDADLRLISVPLSHTHHDNSDLLELSERRTSFLYDSVTHILFVQGVDSAVDTWSGRQTDIPATVSYSLSGFAEGEFSSKSAGKDGSADTVSTRVALSISSPVEELVKCTEASDLDSNESSETDELPDGFIHVYSSIIETPTMSSVPLQPSLTVTYNPVIHYPTIATTTAVKKDVTATDIPGLKASNGDLLPLHSQMPRSALQVSDINEFKTSGIDPAHTEYEDVTAWKTSDICGGVSCPSQRLTSQVFVPVTVDTIPDTSVADGGGGSKQMPNFNTTIIIGSACAVLAVVILVIITIACLRRKKRMKPPPLRIEGDDMWVDLYRNNSSHHMPLPSLTTCQSTFEMTDTLKHGAAQELPEEKELPVFVANSSQVSQAKSHKHVSSFQIKKSKTTTEQDLELVCPVIELEGPEHLGQAENWVKMTTSLSMTSLPTTELSYNTNLTDYNMAAVGHKFRAVYAYKPVCKGEMALKEGELVVCKERDRNGWMFGLNPRTNQEGWFPAVYVDEVSSDYELDFNFDIPETYDILESNKLHNVDQYWTGIEHKVCYQYESSVPGDLNLELDQTVIVLQTLANGWWFAVNENRCGWIPGSYVEMTEDTSSLEVAFNSDQHDKQQDQSSVSTESQSTNDGNIETKTDENSTNFENKHVTDNSKLPENESSDKDNTKQAVTGKTSLTSEPCNENLKINSSTIEKEISNKNAMLESSSLTEAGSVKPMATSTPSRSVEDKLETIQSASTNAINNLSVTTQPIHNENKSRKSFRPVRPAPPPPKRKDSKVKKDITLNKEESNKRQSTVVKKPIILIQGKRPKLHKVLRGQLDDKQLNPMIKPSTRGFMPKPTVHSENMLTHSSFYKPRHEWSSSEHEHTNSSPSIADDFHSELMTLLGQSHETSNVTSPHSLTFRPLPHNDGRSPSKISLESVSDYNTAHHGSASNHILNVKENLPYTKHSDIKHSKTALNNNSRDRSVTPEYKRERSVTPEYKKEKNNSPILLTTGSLLQNVQRFHGALNYPSPPHDTDKAIVRPTDKDISESIPRNMSPHAFNVASRRQRTPTTVPPPKVPPKINFHSSSQPDHRQQVIIPAPMNKQRNYEASSPVQSAYTDINSNREDITDNKRHPPKVLRTDSTGFQRDSLVVAPGTVSEIVHQINTQSPVQIELLPKLRGDETTVEMVAVTDKKM